MADGTHSFVADQQNWNQRVTTEVEAPRQWAETWGPIFQEEKKGVDNLAEGVRLREEFYSSRIEKLEAELKECVTGRPCLRCDAPPPPPLSNAAAAAAAAYAAAAKRPRHAPAARSPARAPAYPHSSLPPLPCPGSLRFCAQDGQGRRPDAADDKYGIRVRARVRAGGGEELRQGLRPAAGRAHQQPELSWTSGPRERGEQ